MNIRESKTEARLENVKPFEPQLVRILDNKGICIAFVIAGHNSTSVQIGLCQENNFEIQVENPNR